MFKLTYDVRVNNSTISISLEGSRPEKLVLIPAKFRALVIINLVNAANFRGRLLVTARDFVIPNRRKNRVDVIPNAIRYSTAVAWGIP